MTYKFEMFLVIQKKKKKAYKYKIIQTPSSSNFIYRVYFWEGLMSSENFHWIRQDLNTCPRVDMCPQSNMFNDNFHWTQAAPYIFLWFIYIGLLVFYTKLTHLAQKLKKNLN